MFIKNSLCLEDPGTMIRCMAENFGQDDRIQECRDCFKNLEGEFMSAGWITAAKQVNTQLSLVHTC